MESGNKTLENMGFDKCTLEGHQCRYRTENNVCLTKEPCVYHLKQVTEVKE